MAWRKISNGECYGGRNAIILHWVLKKWFGECGGVKMARKRFVTSEISTDRKIAKLAEKNPTAAALWTWFITGLDDWGRMNADPVEVKLTIFPAFPYTAEDSFYAGLTAGFQFLIGSLGTNPEASERDIARVVFQFL